MVHNVERLEPRRLFAAASVVAEVTPEGVLVVTGTKRSEVIAVVEHFPGIKLFDVLVDGSLFTQRSANAVRVDGGRGNDTLLASPGDVPLTLMGGSGNDTLSGGAGPAQLDGGNGNDVITGGAAGDVLRGGKGRDALNGGGGNDFLDGGTGNDTLNGGDGADVLLAGNGRDLLDGGAGDDTLSGGRGRDRVIGGAGSDLFALLDQDAEALDFLAGEDRRSAAEA